jgi:hypothetical protein
MRLCTVFRKLLGAICKLTFNHAQAGPEDRDYADVVRLRDDGRVFIAQGSLILSHRE